VRVPPGCGRRGRRCVAPRPRPRPAPRPPPAAPRRAPPRPAGRPRAAPGSAPAAAPARAARPHAARPAPAHRSAGPRAPARTRPPRPVRPRTRWHAGRLAQAAFASAAPVQYQRRKSVALMRAAWSCASQSAHVHAHVRPTGGHGRYLMHSCARAHMPAEAANRSAMR